MDESIYQVKTDKFEGPLDVLLSLIEKKKMHISDVSLSSVTDEYINYIQGNIDQDLPNVTFFLSIAATLVYLKSKMLLDNGSTKDEEMDTASHNLEERLRILELLRSGVKSYSSNIVSPYVSLSKKRNIISVSFMPHASISQTNLLELANFLIEGLPKEKENLPKISVTKIVSLEEMIYKITNNLKRINQKTSFSKIAELSEFENMEYRERKVSVIVSFLAILELSRGGLLNIEQDMNYGDIICEPVKEISVQNQYE
jgi:segregation and condensation protein A